MPGNALKSFLTRKYVCRRFAHNWPIWAQSRLTSASRLLTHIIIIIRHVTQTQIFDRVKEQNAKALHKVIPIQGDIAMPGLGISDSDQLTLTNEVSVVFHSAATVKFDEPLRWVVVRLLLLLLLSINSLLYRHAAERRSSLTCSARGAWSNSVTKCLISW